MRIFDLHCDTLFKANDEQGSIIKNNYHFSLERAMDYEDYTQVMAVWIPDEYRGERAVRLVKDCYRLLQKELAICNEFKQVKDFKKLNSGYNIILSVEGGAALNGSLDNIPKLRELGVRFLTLTWNGRNEIGDGILCDKPMGLTDFGKQAVPKLEENGIIIDVSHASEPLFWDTAELAKKPLVATHSNSRKICKTPRNLTDEQFVYICKTNGLVGINFYRYFIADSGRAGFSDLQNHIEHFLSLGGESVLALGSDYDGAEMAPCIKGVESMCEFYNYLLRCNYSEDLLRKIFYQNANNFCKNFDI